VTWKDQWFPGDQLLSLYKHQSCSAPVKETFSFTRVLIKIMKLRTKFKWKQSVNTHEPNSRIYLWPSLKWIHHINKVHFHKQWKNFYTKLIMGTLSHVASLGLPSVTSCLNTSAKTMWNLSTNGMYAISTWSYNHFKIIRNKS